MLLHTLESLVLRSSTVSTVVGASTVELPRHGLDYQPQTPVVAISKRHASPGERPTFMQPGQRPGNAIDDDGETDAVIGAGRSLRLAGVLRCRSAVLAAASASGRSATRKVVAWRIPATRTPPASTRGKGAR